jgi:hypothetical protein
MHPDDLVICRNCPRQLFQQPLTAFDPFGSLCIEQGSDMDTRFKNPEENIVKENGQVVVFELVTNVQAIVQTICILLFLRHLSKNTPIYEANSNG